MPEFTIVDAEETVFPLGENAGEPAMALTVEFGPNKTRKLYRYPLAGFNIDAAVSDLQKKLAQTSKAIGRKFQVY